MAEKRKKGQTMIQKTVWRKLRIKQQETQLKTESELRCSGRVCHFWFTTSTRPRTCDLNLNLRLKLRLNVNVMPSPEYLGTNYYI